MSKRSLALLLLFSAACEQTPQPSMKAGESTPQIDATVITVRTTTLPANRIYTNTIVIAGDRVRATAEQDVWRLYDARQKTVTFVDDVEKTLRTARLDALVAERRKAIRSPLPSHYPRARLRRTGERQQILGTAAEKTLIESGSYARELWMGVHPAIPSGLFAMMQASETPSTPLAPMMRDVDEALFASIGFPLRDHARLKYAKSEIVVNRDVVGIVRRQVPASLFEIPKGYRDVTPKPAEPGSKTKAATRR